MPSRPIYNRAVTQRDIARLLGISNATVSLALRNSELLSHERREAVLAAAKKMGYRPNSAATELACQKSNSRTAVNRTGLAWINANSSSMARCSSNLLGAYLAGAESAARKLGYHFEKLSMSGDVPPDRFHRKLQKTGVRGILLPPMFLHSDWGDFPWEDYSLVRFGLSSERPLCHGVESNAVANSILALAKMRERGYHRIGFIASGESSSRNSKFPSETVFLTGQMHGDSQERVPVCVVSAIREKDRPAFIANWVRGNEIDGILTDFAGCHELLTEGGFRVPDDLGLACTNVTEIPVAAGINQLPEEIGKAGVSLLNSFIEGIECGVPKTPRQLLVGGIWVDGETLPDRDDS